MGFTASSAPLLLLLAWSINNRCCHAREMISAALRGQSANLQDKDPSAAFIDDAPIFDLLNFDLTRELKQKEEKIFSISSHNLRHKLSTCATEGEQAKECSDADTDNLYSSLACCDGLSCVDKICALNTKNESPATTQTTVTATQVPNSTALVREAGLIGYASVADCGPAGTTGGQGGQVIDVTTAAEFDDFISREGTYTIQVHGMLPPLSTDDPVFRVNSDKTILGIGSNSGLDGAELRIDGDRYGSAVVNNVIVRNMNFINSPIDGIGIMDGAKCIWIDHCEISSPSPTSDGALDIKRKSDFITISWTKFSDWDKVMVIGATDQEPDDIKHLRVTIEHCWFYNCRQRMPKARRSKLVHVLNNYYQNVESYAVGSDIDANVVAEQNYFENVEDPIELCVGDDDDKGNVDDRDNVYDNCHTSKDNCPANGVFAIDPSTVYDCTADSASFVKMYVPAGAGTGVLSCGVGVCASDALFSDNKSDNAFFSDNNKSHNAFFSDNNKSDASYQYRRRRHKDTNNLA